MNTFRNPILWFTFLFLLTLSVIAQSGSDASSPPPPVDGKPGWFEIFQAAMAVVIAVIVLARLIVKLTPTPADDTLLEKIVSALKHIGLNVKLLLFALVPAALFAGCSLLPVRVAPGADPIVVHAEWTAENALSAIDQFLLWEEMNHATLTNSSPGVVAAASALRKNGTAKKEVENLRTITKQYKADRNAAGGERVQAATHALLALANSVLAHMGFQPLVLPVIGPSVIDLMKNAPTNAPPN